MEPYTRNTNETQPKTFTDKTKVMLNRRKEAYETHLQQYQGNRWGIPEKNKREDHTKATLSTICKELDVRDRWTGIIMIKNGYTTRPYRYILYASANARPQPMPARPPARDGTYGSDPLPT